MEKYVWYFGYGSNTLKARFLCYIKGIKFEWKGYDCAVYKDETIHIENKHFKIPYELFFAEKSETWDGGIAFVRTNEDKRIQTYGRLWKVTEEQLEKIWIMEGKNWKYNEKLYVGSDEGIPIWTITNKDADELKFNTPSEKYVKIIMCGLAETYKEKEGIKDWICGYLSEKDGIKDKYSMKDLEKLFDKKKP